MGTDIFPRYENKENCVLPSKDELATLEMYYNNLNHRVEKYCIIPPTSMRAWSRATAC